MSKQAQRPQDYEAMAEDNRRLSPITQADLQNDPSGLGIKRLMLDNANMVVEVARAREEVTASKVQMEQLKASKPIAVLAAFSGIIGTAITGIGFQLMRLSPPAPWFGVALVILGLAATLTGGTASAWLPRILNRNK